MKIKTTLTVGLNDKDAEKQLISRAEAHDLIAEILISEFSVYAFTALDCAGVYRMESTGHIIREQSIRVEMVTDGAIENLADIVSRLKAVLNQETIMVETGAANVDFL